MLLSAPAVPLVSREVDNDPLAFVVPGFLSPTECQAFIEDSERRGFAPAPITTAGGPVMETRVRNNTRVMYDDPSLAERLWERLRPVVPARIQWREAIGVNERFRFYRYEPGQRFKKHFDGCFRRSGVERSVLTFMVYLNDGFEGGHTNFYDLDDRRRFSIQPEAGLALLFIHEQLHEGAILHSGRKYVLRSDVMYRIFED